MVGLIMGQNKDYFSWAERLSSWVNPYHELETEIKAAAKKNLLSPQDKSDLELAFHLAHGWTWPAGRMKKLIEKTSKEHVQMLINDLLQYGNEKEIARELQQYLNFLELDSLLELSGLNTAENAENWFKSRGLIKNSFSESNLEIEGKAIFKEFWIEAKQFFFHILDILVALTGVHEIGPAKSSRWSSNDQMGEYAAISKLETYGKLIGYPAILFGFIYSYIQLKAAAFGLTVLSTFSIIVALVVYQRYLKPCPNEFHGLKNLTLEMLRSKELLYVRQDILRAIEKAFKEKKGVLLVGDPGAGKSWIPRALAQQMAEGKICTFINDGQIFTCGASKLKSYEVSLDSIEGRFKDYNEQVVFFFDEFSAFFKKGGRQEMSQEDDIKMFCEEFKYVIGATTTKEYKQFVKKQPAIIDRRFIVINVGQLSDKKIKTILSQFLQIKHPTIDLEVTTLDYIIKKAKAFNPNTSKIDAAQTLLNRAVKELSTIEFKALEMKIDNLEAEKKLFEQELLHARVGKDKDLIARLKGKQSEIDKAKKLLKKKNKQVDRMRKIEAYYLRLKEQSFQMADAEVALSSDSSLERKWVVLQAKIKVVGDFIENERAKLSLPRRLDRSLIDKIIKERQNKIGG